MGIADLAINKELAEFCKDKRLQERFPNYTVDMGFGLHLGWAIEGAVGSEYKVDATYLSPNVNMAARLEAATRQYDVKVLMSHFVVDQVGGTLRTQCRAIDR